MAAVMPTETEDGVHEAVLRTLRLQLRGAIIQHGRNEGNRRGKAGVIDGQRGKRLGVLAGYPDLVIHYRGMTFFVEVKTKKGTMSKAQIAVKLSLEAQGFRYFICRSSTQANDAATEIRLICAVA